MLEFIVTVISIVKNATYLCLVASYRTGQFIINAFGYVWSVFSFISKNAAAVVGILSEDFLVFLADVVQALSHIGLGVFSTFENVLQFFTSLFDGFRLSVSTAFSLITSTWDLFANGVSKLYTGIGQLITGLKHLLVLLGSGIWFAVTLVPLCVASGVTMTVYYFGCLMDEVMDMFRQSLKKCFMFVQGFYDFVTDVPFESLAGLIAGACIVYVILRFHILLYSVLREYLYSLTNQALYKMNSLLNYIRNNIRLYSPKGQPEVSSEEEPELNHKFCVICQEREKCILILPCKHVCLCAECNATLRTYEHTCPICRSQVHKTMKIYV